MEQQQPPKGPSFFFNLAFFILLIGSFAVLLTNLIIVNSSNNSYLKSVGENWLLGPLLYINEAGTACKNDDQSLINDYWPGQEEGCDCSSATPDVLSKNKMSPMNRGKCKNDSTYKIFCKDIPPVKEIQFQNWKGNYLCGKRLEKNYLDLNIVSKMGDCTNRGKKACGYIDSYKNILCVEKTEYCPYNFIKAIDKNIDPNTTDYYLYYNLKKDNINEVYFSNFNNSDTSASEVNGRIVTDSDYIVAAAGKRTDLFSGIDSKLILTSMDVYENVNKANASAMNNTVFKNLPFPEILIEFRIEDSQPCAYKEYKSYSIPPYILNPYSQNEYTCKAIYTNDVVDPTYKQIDTLATNKDLLVQNLIYSKVSNLPNFSQTLGAPTSLFYRSYLGLNSNCQQDLNKEIIDKKAFINKNFLQSDDTIATLRSVTIAGLVLVALGALTHGVAVFFIDEQKHFLASIIVYGLFFGVCAIPTLSMAIVLTSTTASSLKFMDVIINPSCIDNLSYKSMSNISSNYKAASVCGYIIIVLIIFLISLEVYNVIKLFCIHKAALEEEQNNKTQENNNINNSYMPLAPEENTINARNYNQINPEKSMSLLNGPQPQVV